MKLLVMQFSPTSCPFMSLRSRYSFAYTTYMSDTGAIQPGNVVLSHSCLNSASLDKELRFDLLQRQQIYLLHCVHTHSQRAQRTLPGGHSGRGVKLITLPPALAHTSSWLSTEHCSSFNRYVLRRSLRHSLWPYVSLLLDYELLIVVTNIAGRWHQ
jgi:hypothetical protein